ncbi:hypothetical protein Q3V37_17880 [Micromonospora profundi]|uniref:Uncharacterized protein n=1 Tax=Micromonospora profundi TaxID=1420889 RepID=A0AAJ6L3J4_9ACTN|nr:hypothetical protein [Micromonospora profundi]WLS43288.1 hypothetical protein Q3V37_17880 [Micromonospora profundi]
MAGLWHRGRMTYWLNLFIVETWREFKDAGGTLSGFSGRRWNTAQRLQPGDRLRPITGTGTG